MTYRIRTLAVLGFLFFSSFTCISQNVDDIKKQIATVKKRPNVYLYGEATAATQEEAISLAEGILYDEITQWADGERKLKNASNLLVNNKKGLFTTLTTPRGNMFRGFVFVKKSDISEAGNVDIIEKRQVVKEKPVQEYVYPQLVREVAGLTTYSQLDARLKQARQKGEISDYASTTFPESPQDYFFVVYNQSGQIVAVLSDGENKTNIRTGEPDSLKNYKGKKAVGFKM